MKHWLAAYVRLHHEKRTRDHLLSMGIECFLPVQEEIHQWSDRRKKVELIVLPMIIFVRVDVSERALPLTLSSVLRYLVLRGESTPAIIPDAQMDRFRFMLDYSEETVELCPAPLVPGECVRVIKGPLTGLEGELLLMNGKSKVAIRIDMLGVAQVNMSVRYVEKIRKNDLYKQAI
ncbi:MAG: UpxY family transcription antiterminator [Bacteroides sp.]|uniref:UpxY family transcription antiterminator n=1 Tax=Bacteroides sp. TaxID=29523 RepID=UPI002FC6D048